MSTPYTEAELRERKTFKVQFRSSHDGPWRECEVTSQFIANGLVQQIQKQHDLNLVWQSEAPPDSARIVRVHNPVDVYEFTHPYADPTRS